MSLSVHFLGIHEESHELLSSFNQYDAGHRPYCVGVGHRPAHYFVKLLPPLFIRDGL